MRICHEFLRGRFLLVITASASAEKQGNAPQACQADDGVDDAAYQSVLAAENPGHQVELENAHKAPVNASDDGKDQ